MVNDAQRRTGRGTFQKADDISDTLWYPRAWPTMDPEKLYKDLPNDVIDPAKAKSRAVLVKLFKMFSERKQ